MRFIELFAGIGGFRYGLENCNQYRQGARVGQCIPTRWDITDTEGTNGGQDWGQPFNCVYANEWDKYAAAIYEKNFGEKPDTRDIATVGTNEIPDHDLLTGGFPCQAFSIAGKRKGFEDTRGTMFFEIARILNSKRPRLCLLENVKGLLSHDNGNTFRHILWVLHELGYDVQWQVLNSKNFGVPQNRERVFIIGHLRGTSRPEVFPIRMADKESIKLLPGKGVQNRKRTRTNYVKYEDSQNSVDGYINTNNWQNYIYDSSIRRLTPIECERLQGFPDNWTESISDTQRYKCLGNAVTTNVITTIGERIIKNV